MSQRESTFLRPLCRFTMMGLIAMGLNAIVCEEAHGLEQLAIGQITASYVPKVKTPSLKEKVKALRLNTDSLGGENSELLNHVFPGKYQVSNRLVLETERAKLEFLRDSLFQLEHSLSGVRKEEEQRKILISFEKKNSSWLTRYVQAVVAVELLRSRTVSKSDYPSTELLPTSRFERQRPTPIDALTAVTEKTGVNGLAGAIGPQLTAAASGYLQVLGPFGLLTGIAQAAGYPSLESAGDAERAKNIELRTLVPQVKAPAKQPEPMAVPPPAAVSARKAGIAK